MTAGRSAARLRKGGADHMNAIRPAVTGWLVNTLMVVLSLALLVGVWEAAVKVFDIPGYLIPEVSDVVRSLYRGLTAGGVASWWPHIRLTLLESAAGMALGSAIGLLLGTILGLSRILSRIATPYVVAFQAIPKVALAPLLVVWLGFGVSSKIAISAMIAFFPVLINTQLGLQRPEPRHLELMRLVGASRWSTFWMVRVPTALPMVFAGLEVAVLFSLLGVIVGEFIGAQGGVGVLLLQMGDRLDMGSMFGMFVLLAVIGVTFHQIVRQAGRRIVFWERTDDGARGTNA